MKLTFEDFWQELKSSEIWFDTISVKYARKDLRAAAEKTFLRLLTEPERLARGDYQDFRRLFQNGLTWEKDVDTKPFVPSVAQTQEEIKPQGPILTGEERQKKLAEWKKLVLESPIGKSVPQLTKKEIADEGDWLPKKNAAYKPAIKTEREALVIEAIAVVRAEFYGDIPINGFGIRVVGKFQVFAKSDDDALEILHESEDRVDKYLRERV